MRPPPLGEGQGAGLLVRVILKSKFAFAETKDPAPNPSRKGRGILPLLLNFLSYARFTCISA